MRAVVQDAYGAADVIRVEDVPDPTDLGAEQVLIRVRAAGVDRGVWHLMTGMPRIVRLGTGLRRPRVRTRGTEVAGTVERVGSAVTRFAVGDEVFGAVRAAFAELAIADQRSLATAPRSVDAVHAAALPVSGVTALQAVRDAGRVASGDRVLVLGAAGAVGHSAVQLARHLGAEVTGMCSAGKADLARDAGAVRVLDYAAHAVAEGAPYDVVIDTGGRRPLRELEDALTPTGALVLVGGEGGGAVTGGFERQLAAGLRSRFSRRRLVGLMSTANADDLAELARLVDAGALRPLVERTYALEQAPAALARLASGAARGKQMLIP